MTHLFARLRSPRQSERLRAIGAIVLALGIAGACLFYLIEIHRPGAESLDDVLPGYSRTETHEIGVQMGTFGVIMWGWQSALQRPGTQAVIIAALSALFSAYFFRAAWVLDDDERDREKLEKDREIRADGVS